MISRLPSPVERRSPFLNGAVIAPPTLPGYNGAINRQRSNDYADPCGKRRSPDRLPAEGQGPDPGPAGREAGRHLSGGEQMGAGSFPKLKIPHQSHADFCSTDTAGGLDNKKRRYAPRGGVAYRLFLWGFPKGATPPFGTRLCEAKCSVLYALPALP